jgi:hypothetical protein
MYVPAVVNVNGRVAVPEAASCPEEAVPTTFGAPKVIEPDGPVAWNVTVPVGPAPPLWVEIVAVRVTGAAVVADAGFAATLVAVEAAVTLSESVFEVLAL